MRLNEIELWLLISLPENWPKNYATAKATAQAEIAKEPCFSQGKMYYLPAPLWVLW